MSCKLYVIAFGWLVGTEFDFLKGKIVYVAFLQMTIRDC